MDDYVSKPVPPDALAEVLARWLPKGIGELGKPKPGDTQHASPPSSATVVPRQIEALRGYLDARVAPRAERQAHTIKDAPSNAGGEARCALAIEIEKDCEPGNGGFAADRKDALTREFVRLKEAMTRKPSA
jgi:hypothetical protein